MDEIEDEIPWGKVVESDSVFSPKAGRWFEIESTVRTSQGVKVKAVGVAKYWPPQDPVKLVKVRRGATGKAVDIIEIVFSGEMRKS